jgi:hypothetical protein
MPWPQEELLMKRRPGLGRTPSQLSESLHRQLNWYALAASAAGVSLLALAQPSEARIVYTKTHQVIGANGLYKLDLNHDGKIDFAIKNQTRQYASTAINSLLVGAATSGRGVEGTQSRYGFFAAALKGGTRIPNARKFAPVAKMAFQCGGVCGTSDYLTSGNWVNVASHYLGLKFKIRGQTHYGWARLSVSVSKQPLAVTATLTGYAYETIPNRPIVAGRTSESDNGMETPAASFEAPATTPALATLGLLAMGSPAAPAWKRKEREGGAA